LAVTSRCQLTRDFGKQLLCDIPGADLAAYQTRRKREEVSNRTVNLELGVLRSILRRYRMWEAIAADVRPRISLARIPVLSASMTTG